mgnify:CR=1 FL=1
MDSFVKFGVEIKSADAKDLEEKPLSFGEWLKLNLSDERLQNLVNRILDEIDKIAQERKSEGWDDKVAQYRNQYAGIMAETSLPFQGCYSVNVPMTTKYVDSCIAQTEEAFEDTDPKYTIETPKNKALEPARETQEKILDYYEDTEMSEDDDIEKVYFDAFLLPVGWAGMVYERTIERVRDIYTFNSVQEFQKEFLNDYQKYPNYIKQLELGKQIQIIAEFNLETSRSPKIEHYEFEDIFVPLATNGIDGMLKSRIVARRLWKRWEEISLAETEGDYRKGITDKLKYNSDAFVSGNILSSEDLDPEYMKKEYETFEVIYFVDIDNDGREERCMFNIEKSHKLGLRDIRYPYNHHRPYVIPYNIQRTRKGIYQPAFGEKLQSVNIAANATLNNVLNAAVIANSLSLKVRAGTDAVRSVYEHRWYPGSILELMNLDDVQQFQFATPNLAGLISLFGLLEGLGEDVVGLVPYQMGQESSRDPEAPASKAIALMRKAEIKLRKYIKCLKKSNNELGYQALRLIYQFTPKQRIADILGVDVNSIQGYFELPLKCRTQATGFALEKMFAKRDNIQMLSMLIKDPLIMGNPVKRVQLYETVAKEYGSDWDKKLQKIISVNEVKQMLAKAEEQKKQKKFGVMKKAAEQAMAQGRNQEEAKEIARMAGERYDQMMSSQAQMPQNQEGSKK